MPSRWDFLLDQKPIPILEHLVAEVSKLVAKDLEKWPPPITEMDLELGRKFEPLFFPDAKRPGPAVYSEAIRLCRWELERDVEAVDEYMRNRRYLEKGLSEEERLALLFLSRWLTEQMLGLGDATYGKVKRPAMIRCLEEIDRRIRQGVLGSDA
jgi:hypothetical protein